MGPLVQVFYYIILCVLPFTSKTHEMISNYHYAILFFNLLPIYPLDGGKLVNIFLCYFTSYKKSFITTIKTSFFVLFISLLVMLYKNNISNLFCMFFLLATKLLLEWKKKNYYFEKFLLERYLKNYYYPKIKRIERVEEMMRDHRHLIKVKGRYYSEKTLLRKKFKKDRFIY